MIFVRSPLGSTMISSRFCRTCKRRWLIDQRSRGNQSAPGSPVADLTTHCTGEASGPVDMGGGRRPPPRLRQPSSSSVRPLIPVRTCAPRRSLTIVAPPAPTSGCRSNRLRDPGRPRPRCRSASGRRLGENSATSSSKRACEYSARSILFTATTTCGMPSSALIESVALGLLQDALAGVEQDHRQVGRGGPGDHVARVLLVAGAVGDDEPALWQMAK